jgi:hypothetical protein
MVSRADGSRDRAAQSETKAAATLTSKRQVKFAELAQRWRKLARQLDTLDEDY